MQMRLVVGLCALLGFLIVEARGDANAPTPEDELGDEPSDERADEVTTTPGSGQGSATESTSPQSEDDIKATLAAVSSQPQIPTVRGGTLGVPSALDSHGLQAMASTQAVAAGAAPQGVPNKIDFDLFSRLGGLRLFDSLTIDILAESYKQDLPHVDLLNRPVVPHMVLAGLRDVGFRIRWSRARDTKVAVIRAHARAAQAFGDSVKASVVGEFLRRRALTLTAGARFLQRTDPDPDVLAFTGSAAEALVQYSFARTSDNPACKAKQLTISVKKLDEAQRKLEAAESKTQNPSERTRIEAVKRDISAARMSIADAPPGEVTASNDDLERTTKTLARMPKHSVVAAPSGDAASEAIAEANKNATVAAARIDHAANGCSSGGGYGVTLFGGLSGTMLHTQLIRDEMQNIERPLFKEARITLGADVQSTFAGTGATLLPRMGVYATFSRGMWENRFASPGLKSDVRAFQFEGGLYVSGHLIGGFDLLVSFVALKPYGDHGTQFLINVAPAIGAVLGSKP